MSEIKEALCVVGGDTEISVENWHPTVPDQVKVWRGPVHEEGTTQKAVCVRPDGCPVRLYCSGRVRFVRSEHRGTVTNVITEVVAINARAVDIFDETF